MESDSSVPNDQPTEGTQELDTQPAGIPVTDSGDMVIGGFAFTPTALVPADPSNPPDFEDWDRVGHYLRYIHTGTQFWLGDWLNYGENNYNERYAQAVESTGYELHTLQTYAWVARQVPRSNRLEKVPFGHYVNGIAALPPDEQAKWAKKVADEDMPQSALKQALAEQRAAKANVPTDLWLVVLCKNQTDFDKLEKQMRAQGREVTSRITRRKAEKKPKAQKAKKTGTKVTQKPVGEPKPAKQPKPKPVIDVNLPEVVTRLEGESESDFQKRRKQINNAKFRARQKAAKGGQ